MVGRKPTITPDKVVETVLLFKDQVTTEVDGTKSKCLLTSLNKLYLC